MAQIMDVDDLLALPQPAADHRLAYGAGPLQFGELRLPRGPGPHPVAVIVHGGCWRAAYDLGHVRSLAAALAREGIATWNVEYRRVGDAGGGWPGTFDDVRRGVGHVAALASAHALDLERVILLGHSAGGHLVLWLGGASLPFRPRGIVALAAVTDLRIAAEQGPCLDVIPALVGGPPRLLADRYRDLSPLDLVPLGIPHRLINGARDDIVPLSYGRQYVAAARRAGDDVRLEAVEEAGHFELVRPSPPAWQAVRSAVLELLGPPSAERR